MEGPIHAAAIPTIDEFVGTRTTTDAARQYIQQRFNAHHQNVSRFLGVQDAQFGTDYRPLLDKVIADYTGSGTEYRFLEDGINGQEFSAVLFGELEADSRNQFPSIPTGASDSISPEEGKMKKVMIVDSGGLLRDSFKLRMPTSASPAMLRAYQNQAQQLKNMADYIAAHTDACKGAMPDSVNTTEGSTPPFSVAGPPSFNMYATAEPVTTDTMQPVPGSNAPRNQPPDELYDIFQRPFPNLLSFQLLRPGTIALFEGRFKFWVVRGQPPTLRFYADNVHVISEPPSI